MFKEKAIGIAGRWFDTIHHLDGRIEAGEHGEFTWGKNQIQDRFASLLAALCRAESGYERINFMGVGSGNVSWDTAPPTKSFQATQLLTEHFRKSILQGDIIFIDPVTNLPTGGVPSPKLEITVTLGYTEANGALREFGLFGGTATVIANSGEIVNWISHGRIDKDATMEIIRKVRIEFLTDEFSP